MAACVSYVRDDDAISVASECTLPDLGFGAPLERMSFGCYDKCSSFFPSCEDLEPCDCDDGALFDGDDDLDGDDGDLDGDDGLSRCASSSSSLSDYFRMEAVRCDTPRATEAEHATLRLGTCPAHRHQLAMARFLNTPRKRADPWNHTQPVVHIREHTVANTNAGATLVTERLYDWWSIPLGNMHDCIDFARQILEGVAFLHENHITNLVEAVRPHNIQMDVGLAPMFASQWTRAEFPVRYYFTALSGLHRVRRIPKGGADPGGGDDDDDDDDDGGDDDDNDDSALAAFSRAVDDDTWAVSAALDLVAVGNALELVFGSMPFNPLEPIMADLCDALDSPITAHAALARVEKLDVPKDALFSPLHAQDQ